MATKFYHDIDFLSAGQLLNARLHNVNSTELTALAASLGTDNAGVAVYNTEDRKIYTWNGTAFDAFQIDIEGDIKFAGVINPTNADTVEKVSGYRYVVNAAGTLVATGVTFSPSAVVEVGDQVLFVSATQAYIIQRNDVQATETVIGNIRLATQAEVLSGTSADTAVTPSTLSGKLKTEQYVRQYSATVSVQPLIPLVVNHNLGLVDRNAFTFNAMVNNSSVSVDVDSIDSNNIAVTSLVAIPSMRVTIQGASV